MVISDNFKFLALISKESWKRFARFVRRGTGRGGLPSRATPERLLIAPQDLRTIDASAALDIYSGRFFLAGQMVELNGEDPYRYKDASIAWQRELHKFQWLRHLEGAETNLSQNNAQALVNDWISLFQKPDKSLVWEEEITALRLIAWLSHSIPIVEKADAQFYKNWLRSINTHIRYLKFTAYDAPEGMPRITAKIALAFASICVSDQSTFLRNVQKDLDQELEFQILADGGHVSRNAENLPYLLAMLLPLRESYSTLDLAPSQVLISSIDKMMAALKFHRLGDGCLARFNGVSVSPTDLIATILRHDDTQGQASNEAFASGYQRLERKDTILIADVGMHPESALTEKANAGTLAFEFTDKHVPIVVNCGMPTTQNKQLVYACRTTAAHSTAGINDESSFIIYRNEKYNLEGRVVSGPSYVACVRTEAEESASFKSSHNGYFSRFGVIHHRFIGLATNGDKILGEDKLLGENEGEIKGKLPLQFSIRFHLHPSLSAGRTENGRSILILGGKGIAWKFTCIDALPQLEESTFFSSLSGPRKSKQILLSGDPRIVPSIRWVFEKQLTQKAKPSTEEMLDLSLD